MDDNVKSEKGIKSKAVFSALELLALVFWVLAEKLHEIWQIHGLFLWIAMTFFVLGAAHTMKSIWSKSRIIWPMAGILSVTCGMLIFVTLRAEAMAKPNLILFLNIPQFPNIELSLTDKRLQAQVGQTNFPNIGCLLVPIATDDALNLGKRASDGYQTMFASTPNIEIIEAPDWWTAEIPDGSVHARTFQHNGFLSGEGGGMTLRDIVCKPTQPWSALGNVARSNPTIVRLSIQAKDFERTDLIFQLYCMTNAIEPRFCWSTNGIVNLTPLKQAP